MQERRRHPSAITTLSACAQLWPDSHDRTRAAVDDVLGAAVHPVCTAVSCQRWRSRSAGYLAAPWQTLYFLPEPQGHGALRAGSFVPVTVAVLAAFAGPLSLADGSSVGAE